MKLPPRDAARFFSNPDRDMPGILIYGQDPMRVALRRQDLIATLLGPGMEEEMRLTRLAGPAVAKDPPALVDAVKARGFFDGPRGVLIDDATDGCAKPLTAALDDWQPGDATIVATAGSLSPRSALRKLFEGHKTAYVAAIYNDPPSRDSVEAELKRAGLAEISQPAMRDLMTLAQTTDPGEFRQSLEKLALYKGTDPEPLSPEDIAACATGGGDTDTDTVILSAADGALDALAVQLPRLSAQGINATTLCIALERHFRQLHSAASHPKGPEAGLAACRPPVFGPRRDRMTRQARHWGGRRIETVLKLLLDTDLALRSGRALPSAALVERLFIRIAMMHSR